MRETAVVVAPGRGTYNATELGYLQRAGCNDDLITAVDAYLQQHDRPGISELDGMDTYRGSVHGVGRNASALIYGCALSDAAGIDPDRYEIVAVTGNSMGWYLSLAYAGVTDQFQGGIELVDHMAMLMDELGIGGQLIYPLVDSDWQPVEEREAAVRAALQHDELYESIRLGGNLVLAGSNAALQAAQAQLPEVDGRYPAKLPRHAAFHTPLLAQISEQAWQSLDLALFSSPRLPLIDGRGEIWQPGSDPGAIRDYTLRHQVLQTYDFTRAITVAVREFAPQRIIVLGPGPALGAPVLQTLMMLDYMGVGSREAWQHRQQTDPVVLAMGIVAQRALVTGTGVSRHANP